MLQRFQDEDGLAGYRSPVLAAAGVPHLFTTRRWPGGALDAGRLEGSAGERLRAAAGLATGAALARARQVHGDDVAWIDGGWRPSDERAAEPPAADALVTTRPEVALLVVTADCVPILLAGADGRAVAAVHAGWRGLVAGVVPRALAALAELGARDVAAAVGACLCTEHFEVGPEVAERFHASGLGESVLERAGERPHVDLRRAAAAQLERGGVRRIDGTDRCTWHDEADFWSYRRDVTHGARAATGRLGALIAPAQLAR